jgi:hypothetical protein
VASNLANVLRRWLCAETALPEMWKTWNIDMIRIAP